MATLGYLMARLMSALALSLKANGLLERGVPPEERGVPPEEGGGGVVAVDGAGGPDGGGGRPGGGGVAGGANESGGPSGRV